jgi:hypothetical protein
MKHWYTRGARADRNVKAAVVGALLGYLDAVGKQKSRPGLYALAGGLGSAIAMDEHRIASRVTANERNQKLAMAIADMINGITQGLPSHQLR